MSEPQPPSEMPSAPPTSYQRTSKLPPLVILNPAGGRGRALHLRPMIEQALTGGRGELILTNGPRAAEKLAYEAAEAGRDVVAVGGDGTVAEIGNGILSSSRRVALGIVPCGNGNDYAYVTLKLSKDPAVALETALHGLPVAMDVGQVNERYFLNSLGVGIDANIAAAAEELKGKPLMSGQMLYWGASLREILFHYDRCPELLVSFDDTPGESRLFALAAVSIGPTYGGGFYINPDADPCDGYFDVCTIWKPSRARALRLLPMIEKGRHQGQPEVTFRRAQTIALKASKPIYAHLDGEVITASAFLAKILPGALLVRRQSASAG
jgi:diacylglycerol kinase (ATP)